MSDTVQVYGSMLSQPTRSVVIFCNLSNVPFVFHEIVTRTGENLTEEFTRINPYQAIPAIVHGEYNLWESPAIVTYLADAFGVDNQWYPKDIKTRGRIDAYLHWHHQGCRGTVRMYVYSLYVGPVMYGKPKPTPEELAPIKATFDEYFDTLKWMISETGYVARTPQASIADIFAYSEITMNILVGFDISSVNSEVQEWYQKIAAIPAVHDAHEVLRKQAESIRNSETL